MSLRFSLQRRLDDFTLTAAAEIETGTVSGVFGQSGAGKTSLLRCLCGLDAATGNIWLDETSVQTPERQLPPHRRGIAFVSQVDSLLPHLTVAGNLHFAEKRAGRKSQTSSHSLATLLGIEHLLHRRPLDLSGGETRRVTIARALLSAPHLLLLDEPLTGLHGEAREQLMTAITSVQREAGISILWVSHDIHELAHVADSLLVMERGLVVSQGPISTVLCDVNTRLGREAGAVWDCHFVSEADNLLELATDSVRLRLPRPSGFDARPSGHPHRLYIPAAAVSITLQPAEHSSILNILPVTVCNIGECTQGQALVKLDTGAAPMLARISEHSLHALKLKPGLQAWAQIKAVSLING